MKILLVGGSSSLAVSLKPILSKFSKVLTAGRTGCDVYIDLLDPIEKFDIPDNIDIMINAATVSRENTAEFMFQSISVNVLGSLKLCQLCTRMKITKLIHISSIFACLNNTSSSYNIYSLSKKHSGEVIQLYSKKIGLEVAIIRPSQFYGVGEKYRKNQPFLFSIIDKVDNNEDITFWGTNDAQRNYIHVEDISRIIAILIQKNIQGIYDCMYTKNTSYFEIATAAIEAFNSKSTIKYDKNKPDIDDNILTFNDSLYRIIDYYPQITILQGMKKEAKHRKSLND